MDECKPCPHVALGITSLICGCAMGKARYQTEVTHLRPGYKRRCSVQGPVSMEVSGWRPGIKTEVGGFKARYEMVAWPYLRQGSRRRPPAC